MIRTIKATLLYAALLFCLTVTTHVQAQNAGLSTQSNDPLEITADGTLEWLRNNDRFVARNNAKAQQGTASVEAQTLTADYRDAPGESSMQIYQMTADQNVILTSQDSKAYGQNAVYDLDEGLATMTGNNLKMVSVDQTVTARDKFEYWVTEGRVNAIGDAVVVRPKPQGGTDTLKADKVSAILKENAQGKRVLHSLEAIGNVVIITPTETVTGAYGIYKADTNKAEITGGVKILRGPNTLEGERAEVDMNTNTSKIFGSQNETGRVRGVFYPGSEKKEEPEAQTPPENQSTDNIMIETEPNLPPPEEDLEAPHNLLTAP